MEPTALLETVQLIIMLLPHVSPQARQLGRSLSISARLLVNSMGA